MLDHLNKFTEHFFTKRREKKDYDIETCLLPALPSKNKNYTLTNPSSSSSSPTILVEQNKSKTRLYINNETNKFKLEVKMIIQEK